MNVEEMTPSQDGSPFDLPKSYLYQEITEYHKNKALQLLKIKNYDLALTEVIGLEQSSKNIKDNSHNFEQLILDIKSKINKRNDIRNKYLSQLSFNNTEINKKNILKNFIIEGKDFEEYDYLQEYIINLTHKDLDKAIKTIFSFDPLKYLIEIGRIKKDEGLNPFMLFDLDSTLFDNSPRVHKIIQDFINEHKNIYPQETEKMSMIKRQDIVWGIKENLKKVNIIHDELSEKVIKYWFERFFSNDYVVDVPLNGASEFVRDIQDAGLRVVYLTGRFESMREGTERNIIEHNFPLDQDGGNLILKPDPKTPDHLFKNQTMQSMKRFGEMIAGFENEPLNSNIFQEHYSQSSIFFLETNHSLNPPNLNDKIHTLKNFCYF